MKLRGFSYHSVKGGVGKSTLAVEKALQLARERPELPVILIDMDLTGTSLADVLELCAPKSAAPHSEGSPTSDGPLPFHTRARTQELVEQRQEGWRAQEVTAGSSSTPRLQQRPVPPPPGFLNDYLLHATQDWDEQEDMAIEPLLWELEPGPSNLRVIPSSALPIDLEHLMPVIFDEEHAAYLEGRLEHLLALLLERHSLSGPRFSEEICVVIDTPPTLPGLSRAVLSLALRLRFSPFDPQRQLSEDGGMPEPLEQCDVEWEAWLVVTPDLQDLRAAARWFRLADEDERRVLKFMVNRAPVADPANRQAIHRTALVGYTTDPQVLEPVWSVESEHRRLFQPSSYQPGRRGTLDPGADTRGKDAALEDDLPL